MHTGRYAALLAADVQAAGGIMTVQDLATAQPQVNTHMTRPCRGVGLGVNVTKKFSEDVIISMSLLCPKVGLWLNLLPNLILDFQ